MILSEQLILPEKVTWWENLGDETFNEHLIDNTWNGTAWVFINDLDNDNDKDIIAVAEISDAILLWENDGNENFTVDPVVTSYSGAFFSLSGRHG